jgi:cation:H+ antiporter
MVAALAADSPEITAAATALASHHANVGAGVVMGSNVFNLAALLGLPALVAGQIVLHRRVIVMESVVALWIAGVCVAVVAGAFSPVVGLLVALAVLGPYLVLLGVPPPRLRRLELPAAWVRWLRSAIVEEERELELAIHPRRGRPSDVGVAALAVVVVVAASIVMTQSAERLGTRHDVPGIVTGALVLAAVTSLPNAVAAVYLAVRGRASATLSMATNSNAINVVAGLLLPAIVVGLGPPSGETTLVGAWYVGLTALALGVAYSGAAIHRKEGAAVIGAYLAFAAVLVTTAR